MSEKNELQFNIFKFNLIQLKAKKNMTKKYLVKKTKNNRKKEIHGSKYGCEDNMMNTWDK